jgi:hypothetical protein
MYNLMKKHCIWLQSKTIKFFKLNFKHNINNINLKLNIAFFIIEPFILSRLIYKLTD